MASTLPKLITDYLVARSRGESVTAPTVKFTESLLKALPPTACDYVIKDGAHPGLVCRVRASGRARLEVVRKVRGKVVRVGLCNVGELPLSGPAQHTVEKRYIRAVGAITDGQNPNTQARVDRAQKAAEGLTLRQALKAFLEDAELAEGSARNYRRACEIHLQAWLDLPLSAIKEDVVIAKHKEISQRYPVAANNTMKILGSIWSYTRFTHKTLPPCPTGILSNKHDRRAKWNRERRRTGYLKPDEFKAWWASTEQLPAEQRDYLRTVLLTGMRRREVSHGLIAERVNLKGKTLTIVATKNSDPLELPLSDALLEILTRRHKAVKGKGRLFPNIEEVRQILDRVTPRTTVHDLRRSFVTIAEGLGFGVFTLKALVNHRVAEDDVTAGYVRVSTESLRKPTQAITDAILTMAGVRASTVVTPNVVQWAGSA